MTININAITGIFFDGITSKEWRVRVVFEARALKLIFDEPYNGQKDTLIDIENILEVDSPSEDALTLHIKGDQIATLEINQQGIAPEFRLHYAHLTKKKSYSWQFKLPLAKVVSIAALSLALIVLSYFFVIPRLSDVAVKRIPITYEEKWGTLLAGKILNDYKIDSSKTILIRSFVKATGYGGNFKLNPFVVNSSMINAFALPGGTVIICDSILTIIKSPDELAALLAHEYCHVELRHTMSAAVRSIAGYAFISLLLGDVSGLSAILLDNARNLKDLQYQRALEEAADKKGLQMMVDHNIDPKGMEHLLNHLDSQSKGFPKWLEFMSTHPDTKRRGSYVKSITDTISFKPVRTDSLDHYYKLLVSKAPSEKESAD